MFLINPVLMGHFFKKPLFFVMFFIFLGLGLSNAEIKLRIYLKDGSLKAGNLVQESEDSFVILSQSGRAEIPKKDIMFVNGKTLKQWQDRPDKLFQTEIIPSKLPEANFVNDKAKLPKPVKLPPKAQPLPPLISLIKEKADQEPGPKGSEKKTPNQLEKAQPLQPPVQASPPTKDQPTTPQSAQAVTPMTKPEVKQEPVKGPVYENLVQPNPKKVKSEKKPVVVAKPKAKQVKPKVRKKKSITKALAKKPKPQKKKVVASAKRPRRYSRTSYASYHFKRAKAFMAQGEKGKAIQELHFATTLNRRNSEGAFLLGKLYMEQGVYDRAKKTLIHPGLKKRDDVANMISEMDSRIEEKKKSRLIFYASASIGFLASIPVMLLTRRVKNAFEPKIIIDAQTISLPEKKQEVPSPLPADLEDRLRKTEGPPTEPEPVKETAKPEVKEPAFKPPPPPPPRPIPEPPKVPDIGKQKPPVTGPVSPPNVPIFPGGPVPVSQAPEQPTPPAKEAPPPVQQPVPQTVSPTEEEHRMILKVAKQVDEAIQRGNDFIINEEIEKARREYRTALALNPYSMEAYLGIGYLCFAKGQWELAMEHYVKALEIDPNSAEAHYGLGRVLLESRGGEEGIFELRKTLELDPTFEDARDSLTALGKAA